MAAILILALIGCQSEHSLTIEQENNILQQRTIWINYLNQAKIDELVKQWSKNTRPQSIVFTNAHVITLKDTTVLRNISVAIENGKISKIGNFSPTEFPKAKVIEAQGRYLLPGLTDVHVHIGESNDEKLLNLACGITSVRDMCGFSWMLEYRKLINESKILAPTTYVAGTMLNYYDLGIYSEVVKSEEEAAQCVRVQKQLGYDYIKVWNNMPLPILKAIDLECRKQNISLVGHIPHDILLSDLKKLNLLTAEHFKGYILDRTLELTQEDYVKQTLQLNFWLCPTFALYLQGLKGEPGKKFVNEAPEMKYVSPIRRSEWLSQTQSYQFGKFGNVPIRSDSIKETVFKQLVNGTQARFIAGTDNNGENVNMVAGFVLYHELEKMKSLGLSDFEVLKTATVNAATALQAENEMGTLEVGKRADLILLDKNPLQDISHLRGRKGVIARGVWLAPNEVQEMLDRIEQIYHYEWTDKEIISSIPNLIDHLLHSDNRYLVKPSTLAAVANALAKIGAGSQAMQVAQHNIDTYGSYDTHDALAHVYLVSGDTVAARKELEKSLQLYGHNESAKEVLAKLNK